MADQRSETPWKWILPGVIVPVVVALIGAGFLGPWNDDDGDDADTPSPTIARDEGFEDALTAVASQVISSNASIFLSALSGPGGTPVNVSGEGFAPNEEVVLRFHTEEIGRTRANAEGRFSNVGVTIPKSFSVFAPQQFTIVAVGSQSSRSARAAFNLSG